MAKPADNKTNNTRKPKGVSADTQAIIDRLVHEGELVRNNGANSIRSVKIGLDKFSDIFATISKSIVLQTDLTKQSLDIARMQLNETYMQNDLTREVDEDALALAKKKAEEDAEAKAKAAATDALTKDDDKPKKDVPLKDRLINTAKETGGFIAGLMKLAGGVFLGYNFVKGLVDELTGGKFSELETKFKGWLNKINENLDDPLVMLLGGMAAVSAFRLAFSGFGTLLTGAGGAIMKMFGIDKLGNIIGKSALMKGLMKGGAGMLALRATLATAAIALIGMGVDKIKDYMVKQGIATEVEIAGLKIDYVDMGGKVVQGAISGFMLAGPAGAIAGAITGLAWGITDVFLNDANRMKEKVSTLLDESEAKIKAAYETVEQTTDKAVQSESIRAAIDSVDKAIEEADNSMISKWNAALNPFISWDDRNQSIIDRNETVMKLWAEKARLQQLALGKDLTDRDILPESDVPFPLVPEPQLPPMEINSEGIPIYIDENPPGILKAEDEARQTKLDTAADGSKNSLQSSIQNNFIKQDGDTIITDQSVKSSNQNRSYGGMGGGGIYQSYDLPGMMS